MIEIIVLIFIIIFWKEGKHDAIISKGELTLKESQEWHKIDFQNWVLIGGVVSYLYYTILSLSDVSLPIVKGLMCLVIIGALRIIVFNPRIAGLLGQGFFYIGNTSKYDKVVKRLGKWHWFIWAGILLANYILIKII